MVDVMNKPEKFPGMCPHCGGQGCSKCGGSGSVEMTMAQGAFFTPHCTNPECGFDNGGRIVKEGTNLEDVRKKCINCGMETVVWKYMGQV